MTQERKDQLLVILTCPFWIPIVLFHLVYSREPWDAPDE